MIAYKLLNEERIALLVFKSINLKLIILDVCSSRKK
jgi:hypothetical protein